MTNPTPEQQINTSSLDFQAALAITALAAALCKQPGIDGQKLRLDFLDALEGIANSPEGVGSIGRDIASVMSSVLDARAAGID
ncbi:hypothetical protein [Acidovorax sp. Leaf73]|uniref:hypothetical protein n=1 Tax=Acidovorax sp. Leaf73 TaxID=2876566 RepID=UPI001E4B0E0E|nr:hypothetical protein [Acidovorax sp. Leaf73]